MQARRAHLVSVLFVTTLAGCGPTLRLHGQLCTATQDRQVLACVTEQGVSVMRREGTTRIFKHRVKGLPAVIEGADSLMLAGRDHLVFVGTATRIKWDLWGHSGKMHTAAAVLDLGSSTLSPLRRSLAGLTSLHDPRWGGGTLHRRNSASRIYAWRHHYGASDVQVWDTSSNRSGTISNPSRTERLSLLEVAGGRALVARVTDPAKGEARRLTGHAYSATPDHLVKSLLDQKLPPFAELLGLALSPDGKLVAYWGREQMGSFDGAAVVGVLDVATGRHRLRRRDVFDGSTFQVEFAPDNRAVLALDSVTRDNGLLGGRVRLLSLHNGEPVKTWTFRSSADQILWPAWARGFWYVEYGEARFVRVR